MFLVPFFLCWGSFLNVIAYRLMHETFSFFDQRSRCPHCKYALTWYDNIPVVSWLTLKAQCRKCKKKISWLYPFIEIFSALSLFFLVLKSPYQYIPAYFLFFSALIITIRTDLETMYISRLVSLWLIPFGLLFSYLNLLPLSFFESIFGAVSGYLTLYCVVKGYYLLTKKIGMGQGDLELLAFIGSFTGIFGWWLSLLIGSCLGTVVGLIIVAVKKTSFKTLKIPFGPFLACGAIMYVLYGHYLVSLIFGL